MPSKYTVEESCEITRQYVLQRVKEYENQPRFDQWAMSSALSIVIYKPIWVPGSVWQAIDSLLKDESLTYDGKKLISYRA